jgi:hypothetical protein
MTWYDTSCQLLLHQCLPLHCLIPAARQGLDTAPKPLQCCMSRSAGNVGYSRAQAYCCCLHRQPLPATNTSLCHTVRLSRPVRPCSLKACPHRSIEVRLRLPGVDLWTSHKPTWYEVALQFMLLGAVYLHRCGGTQLGALGCMPCCAGSGCKIHSDLGHSAVACFAGQKPICWAAQAAVCTTPCCLAVWCCPAGCLSWRASLACHMCCWSLRQRTSWPQWASWQCLASWPGPVTHS